MQTHFGMLSFAWLCVCVILTNYYFIVRSPMKNLRIHCDTKAAEYLLCGILYNGRLCTRIWHVRILNFAI